MNYKPNELPSFYQFYQIITQIMPRFTKKLGILLLGVIFVVFYCEFLIYYIVIGQCWWPSLEKVHDQTQVLKALIVSDIHIFGPRTNFLDKWRRESQMHRAFQTIIQLYHPEVVFVLGDQFDEGEGTDDATFHRYVDRFYDLFRVPNDTKMFILVGNHDIGFHKAITMEQVERFTNLMNSPTVQLVTMKDNHFVMINSMAMENDSCALCNDALNKIDEISDLLSCSKIPGMCGDEIETIFNYSRPLLLQHFPLYRASDGVCNEPDSAPMSERFDPFRDKIDALSKDATQYLISKLKPRVAFGGHTHYGCLLNHKYDEPDSSFKEYSVPSFNWRNINVPKYMLVSISPEEYAVSKCALPSEITTGITAVICIFLLFLFTLKVRFIRKNGYCHLKVKSLNQTPC